MREDKTKFTVKYYKSDNKVFGYYPNDVDYPNESFEENATFGYIEITKDEWENRPRQAVVNGSIIEEYIRPDNELLQIAKDSKIAQIKKNRTEANKKPMISAQANEITYNGDGTFTTTTDLVYFAFRTVTTDDLLTNPANLINACLRGQIIKYSCEILNPSRKGYVEIDSNVASNIENHLVIRAQHNVIHANDLEDQVNACSTIEEVDNINIDF